jgi:hypothetical protein
LPLLALGREATKDLRDVVKSPILDRCLQIYR